MTEKKTALWLGINSSDFYSLFRWHTLAKHTNGWIIRNYKMAIFTYCKLSVPSMWYDWIWVFMFMKDVRITSSEKRIHLRQKQTRFHKRRKLNSNTLHIVVLDLIIPLSSHVKKNRFILSSADLHSLYSWRKLTATRCQCCRWKIVYSILKVTKSRNHLTLWR
jgi:hypothetical protein